MPQVCIVYIYKEARMQVRMRLLRGKRVLAAVAIVLVMEIVGGDLAVGAQSADRSLADRLHAAANTGTGVAGAVDVQNRVARLAAATITAHSARRQRRSQAQDSRLPGDAPAPLVPPGVPLHATGTTATMPQATTPWTFAVYIAGDNDLARNIDTSLQKMIQSGGSNANLNIVALVDTRPKDGNPQKEPTRYYEIRGTGLVDKTQQAGIEGNIDTADPQAFVKFMQFVKQHYTAEKYAVAIWSHGSGWEGVAEDGDRFWSMDQLRSALMGGLEQLGKARYDVLLFDACHMAQYEVVLEIGDLVDVLVASEEIVPEESTPYDSYLPVLRNNPAITAEQFARAIVEKYAAFYAGEGDSARFTISALKMGTPLVGLQSAIDAFAVALLEVGGTRAGDIKKARENTRQFNNPDFITLGDFALQIKERIGEAQVQMAAAALIEALSPASDGFVLSRDNGAGAEGSSGLSIYMPGPGKGRRRARLAQEDVQAVELNPAYDDLQVRNTAWYALLTAYTNDAYTDEALPDVPELPPPPALAAASANDIVYSYQVTNRRADLYRVNAVTSTQEPVEPLPLREDGYANWYASWSPDGTSIVYAANRRAAANSPTGLLFDLFLIDADGTPPNDLPEPHQLTMNRENCPNGPGSLPCTVELAIEPAWLPDGSGIIYTRQVYDYSFYPVSVTRSSAIHQINLARAPNDPDYDTRLLPDGALFGDDVQFFNANFNGDVLLFTYQAPPNVGYEGLFGPDIVYNHIGFVDYAAEPIPFYAYFILNTQADVESGHYIEANYPTWRPASDEFAFYYRRVGNPALLGESDPRPTPPAGQRDRPGLTYTYDIGRLRLEKTQSSYLFNVLTPIWLFSHPERGEGVNYRPSWKLDGSGSLTASYSTDSGYTYDVGLFLNVDDPDLGEHQFLKLTTNGYSAFPAWGRVMDVKARLDVEPQYLVPGPRSNYYLSGRGFVPGETVELLQGDSLDNFTAVIDTVQADSRGAFSQQFTLRAGPSTGTLFFEARGTTPGVSAVRISNRDVLVVLPRSFGNVPSAPLYLPLVVW